MGTRVSDWCITRLGKARWIYIWVEGIYSGLGAEQVKLCALIIIGVNERGEKHFLAIEDGAMGFLGRALEETYPETRQQRCWMHKMGHVLNTLPKSLQPKAKQALHDIWQADTRDNAEKALEPFVNMIFPLSTGKGLQDDNLIEPRFATIRHRTKCSKGCLSAVYGVQAQPMC